MSNYPPGVHSGTPNAPWNQPEPPTCPECHNHIVSAQDHKESCPCEKEQEELSAYWAEANAPGYDKLKDQEQL
jgi:hypothetical protein